MRQAVERFGGGFDCEKWCTEYENYYHGKMLTMYLGFPKSGESAGYFIGVDPDGSIAVLEDADGNQVSDKGPVLKSLGLKDTETKTSVDEAVDVESLQMVALATAIGIPVAAFAGAKLHDVIKKYADKGNSTAQKVLKALEGAGNASGGGIK